MAAVRRPPNVTIILDYPIKDVWPGWGLGSVPRTLDGG